MDIDQLKPITTSEHYHMEMMLMMQMDKQLEYTNSYIDASDQIHFSQASNPNCNNIGSILHFIENQNQHAALNFPSNKISFPSVAANSTQETLTESLFCNNHNNNDTYSGAISWRSDSGDHKKTSMAAMREMIFRIASMQPIHIDPESVKPPKRRNVKISKDPQSVAARHRRERISERIRILQRLVPGGTKMDTASMLDEAIHYVKFLKSQVQSLERAAADRPAGLGFPVAMSSGSYLPMGKGYQPQNAQHFYEDA